jgi:hypothetical protein
MPQVLPFAGLFAGFLGAGAPISLAAGVGFGVAGGAAAVLGGAALSVALLAGTTALQFALRPQAPKAISPQTSTQQQQDLKRAIKSTIAPERIALGTVQSSGVIFFEESENPHYYAGYILASHQCEGLESIWVDNQRVFLTASGDATSTPFFDGSNVFLKINFRNGLADQARDQIITDNAADFDATYGTDFRQRGLTTAVLKAKHGDEDHQDIWGTSAFLPQIQVRYKGALLYDPRNPVHDINDSSTWEWSDNAALCAAYYLTYPWASRPRFAELASLDWARIGHAADICDRWRSRSDGTRERDYTINGIIQSTEIPVTVVQGLLAAMNATPVIYQGKWFPKVFDAKENPVGTLHDGFVVGDVSLRTERPAHEIFNSVRANFISPERDYTPQETPAYIDAAALALDNNIPREAPLTLPFTEGNERAQRLAKMAITENRLGRALTCEVDIAARPWQPGDHIRVDLETLPEMNGTYKITRRTWLRNGTAFALTLEEYDASIGDWNATNDVQPFTLDEDLAA